MIESESCRFCLFETSLEFMSVKKLLLKGEIALNDRRSQFRLVSGYLKPDLPVELVASFKDETRKDF